MNSTEGITHFRPFNEYQTREEFDIALDGFQEGLISDIDEGTRDVNFASIYENLSKSLRCFPEQFNFVFFANVLSPINGVMNALLEAEPNLDIDDPNDGLKIVKLSNQFLGSLKRYFNLTGIVNVDNVDQVKALFAIAILQKEFLCKLLKITNQVPDSRLRRECEKKFLFIQKVQVESLSVLLSLPIIVGLKSAAMEEDLRRRSEDPKRLALLSNALLESSISFFFQNPDPREEFISFIQELDPILWYFMEYIFPKSEENPLTSKNGNNLTGLVSLEALNEQHWDREDPENPIFRDALSLALQGLRETPLDINFQESEIEIHPSVFDKEYVEPSALLKKHLLPSFSEILDKLRLGKEPFLSSQDTSAGKILSSLDLRVQKYCIEKLEEVFSCRALDIEVFVKSRQICIHPDQLSLSYSKIVFEVRQLERILARFDVQYFPSEKRAVVWKVT